MKVAIASRPYDGPWGGGNRFVTALCEALRQAGASVVHALADDDIDIILLVDPRMRSPNVCFGPGAVLRYLTFRNPNAIVVHRINECDERKNKRFINHRLVRANYAADVTVFVGRWLTELPVWRKHLRPPWYVIHNGADTKIFNRQNFRAWTGTGPLKLVTHHWGYHPMKGFDVYQRLDTMLGDPAWHERIAFTYIGQLPRRFSFKRARYVPPLDGCELATELASHHAYLTASLNEPGGHHQNEGALCGLPLLYRQSGCMTEYCAGFGIPFSGPADFEAALHRLFADYERLVEQMPHYPWTAERMTNEWLALFQSLMNERAKLVAQRRPWRNPWKVLINQFSF